MDSTEAYYWTGYNPSDPNLPRGYYAYGKARDPWALGLRSLSLLIQSMKKIAEKVDVTTFKKPSYTQGFLAPRVVVVSTGRVVRALKPRLRTVRFELLPLRMLRRRPQRAKGKDVLVLIKNSRAPRRLPLLGPPLNIQKAQDALPMDPRRYPRGIAQKGRFICVITASTVKGLVQRALSVMEVRDADEKALRPRECVPSKTASPKTPANEP